MALTFTPNNPIIPIRLGIKHDPPTLALVYKRKQQDIKERIYSIVLNGLVELSDPKIIALKLFEEHALILNENVIDIDQVEKLVAELQKRYEEKKALQQFNNPLTKDLISPIHTYQSANKNPYNIQDNDTDIFLDNTQTNNLQSNNFHHDNNESIQNDYNDSSYQNQNLQQNLLTLQTPIQNNNNISSYNNVSSTGVDQFNQNQLSDDGELLSSGYNPSFSTKAGSASEQKRQKVKNKNEKNKMNLGATHKNLNELIQGDSEKNMQQYVNSHYNYGQRRNNNNDTNYLNNNNLDNEFIDENQLYNNNNNNEYNEDYHDLMNEDNYLYQNNNNNNYNTQFIQIPQSIQEASKNVNLPNKKNNQQYQMWQQNNNQNNNYPYQGSNVKGYINTQMDYQQNFNEYQDNYAINNNYQNNNNNSQYFNNQNNQNAYATQSSNAPFFSKRQSQSMGTQNKQLYEPQADINSKKRRSKLDELKQLANQHRDAYGNIIDDQLEVI